MQNKLNKVQKEIKKTEEKISEFQSKLKALHKEKTEIENIIMIDVLRKHKVNHNDLPSMLQIFEEENGAVVPLKINKTEEKTNETL